MLLTLASLVLLQVPADGVLTVELGEQRTLKLPGLQRIAFSVGQADCKSIGNDEVLFLGTELGKAPFHGWLTNGKHVTFLVNVVASKGPRPVPVTTQRKGDVTVFEFNEELTEITETREVDGGILIRGKNRKGLGVEVMLTPKN